MEKGEIAADTLPCSQTGSGRVVAMRNGARERDRLLGDAMIDLYAEWREECSAVQLAYEWWRAASTDERTVAFADYNAALDREERASERYAALIRRATLAAPQTA